MSTQPPLFNYKESSGCVELVAESRISCSHGASHPQPSKSHQWWLTSSGTTTATYCHLNISHGVVQTSTNNTDQLLTKINRLRPQTLIVMVIPFLGTSLHLGGIVGSEGETLEMTMSRDWTQCHEVLKGETPHVTEGHAARLGGSVNL